MPFLQNQLPDFLNQEPETLFCPGIYHSNECYFSFELSNLLRTSGAKEPCYQTMLSVKHPTNQGHNQCENSQSSLLKFPGETYTFSPLFRIQQKKFDEKSVKQIYLP